MTNKLKVGDIVYCYTLPERGRINSNPPTLEEYEVIKVGRQYYTVRRVGFEHSYYDHQIVIETFNDKDKGYLCNRLWFRSMEDYNHWAYRRQLVANIGVSLQRNEYNNYVEWTTEDLEQLLDLLKKYNCDVT